VKRAVARTYEGVERQAFARGAGVRAERVWHVAPNGLAIVRSACNARADAASLIPPVSSIVRASSARASSIRAPCPGAGAISSHASYSSHGRPSRCSPAGREDDGVEVPATQVPQT
jgi:hypothetical protein